MATYTNSDGYSFVRTFLAISVKQALPKYVETVDVRKRMPEYHYYRTLWWEKGDFNPKAKWEETTLPYTHAVGGNVNGVRMSLMFVALLNRCWSLVDFTDASILGLGAIRKYQFKEVDVCFRPEKLRVRLTNGSDGQDETWSNLVVEVAYSEKEEHVLNKAKDYWLGNLSRVHDAIVIKIDEVPLGQAPLRMQTQKNSRYPAPDLCNVINKE
ncbi:8897_t:CDS:2 [Acaulospora morrowiae]|uniref:8897_t:CDS:1 n=1 Tax=Acaulospora morrowiae TaxID=94023 RepID=A0A9N8YR96_9GLOM|nr:8897_t:CDS:2 [Acaulospora morrowiae]